MTNFHTAAYNSGAGSTTSIGNIQTGTSFAWQVGAGITFLAFDERLAIDLGYNYYDGGSYKTSDSVMVNTTSFQGSLSNAEPWKGRFAANELIVAFRFNF